jgi:ABC-2 type transport system permease protein
LLYRQTLIMSMASGLAVAMVQYYLWKSVFQSRTVVAGLGWREMTTYIVLSAVIQQLFTFRNEAKMMSDISSGHIIAELLRPTAFLGVQTARNIGAISVNAVYCVVAFSGIGVAVLGALPPADAAVIPVFLLAALGGLAINIALTFCTSVLCFWTDSTYGLVLARQAVTNLLSGALFPLAMLPDAAESVLNYLPFVGIVSTPVKAYLGLLNGGELIRALLVEAAWIIALWSVVLLLWRFAKRRISINGG